MDENITPDAVTRIRVHDEHMNWAIDGADDDDNYTEEIWTHWDGAPLTRETALAHVDDFAKEHGLPAGLPVYLEVDPKSDWVQVR